MEPIAGIGKVGESDELTPDQKVEVARLAARDREVRAHEAAHLAVAGGLARGGAKFTYEAGPDGKLYAVGGSVNIDTSSGRTPEETLAKARQIRAAATAPADPSGQDASVSSRASQLESQAQKQMAERVNEAKPVIGTRRRGFARGLDVTA